MAFRDSATVQRSAEYQQSVKSSCTKDFMKKRPGSQHRKIVSRRWKKNELVHHSFETSSRVEKYHVFVFQVLGFLLWCCTNLCEGMKATGCVQSHTCLSKTLVSIILLSASTHTHTHWNLRHLPSCRLLALTVFLRGRLLPGLYCDSHAPHLPRLFPHCHCGSYSIIYNSTNSKFSFRCFIFKSAMAINSADSTSITDLNGNAWSQRSAVVTISIPATPKSSLTTTTCEQEPIQHRLTPANQRESTHA